MIALDAIVAPLGGGGLLAGTAVVAKARHSEAIRVIGAEADASPVFTSSLAAGRIVTVRVKPTVADGLAALATSVWVEVDAVFAVLRAQPAPLAVAASPLTQWGLYLEDPRHGSLGPAGEKAWNVLEGRYALCVLFEYAATLGVVDVAYTGARGARADYRGLRGAEAYDSLSRYDGLAAVRVNELGAAILHDPSALPALGLPVPRRILP